jgi:hypothetical protein
MASMLDPPPGAIWLTPELLREFFEVSHVRTAPNMRFHAMYQTLCSTFDEGGGASFRAHVTEPTLAFIREEREEGGDGAVSGEGGGDQREQDEQDVDEYMKSEYICFGLPKGVVDLGVEDSVMTKWENSRAQYKAMLDKEEARVEARREAAKAARAARTPTGGLKRKRRSYGGLSKMKRKQDKDSDKNIGKGDSEEEEESGGEGVEEEEKEVFVKFVPNKWTPPDSLNLKEGTLLVRNVKGGTQRVVGVIRGGKAMCSNCEMHWGHVRWASCSKATFNHAKYTKLE